MPKDRKEYYKKYRQSEKRKAYMKEYNKKYREQHKEYYDNYNKKYHEEHKQERNQYALSKYYENREERIAKHKKYCQQHKEELNKKRIEYARTKRQQDPIFKLKCSIRGSLNDVFRRRTGYQKRKRLEEILGCTLDEFITYLQSKFQEGMTLENHRRMAHRPYNTYI